MIRINYEMYREFVKGIAEQARQWGADEVICMMRGGMSASHIISRELKLPVGVYYPSKDLLVKYNETSKKLLFVEDIIATGRTYKELYAKFKDAEFDWLFAPVMVDGKIDFNEFPEGNKRIIYGLKTHHLVVDPYTEDDFKYEYKVYNRDRYTKE